MIEAPVLAAQAPRVGVILLDTRFPRPPGDIGQALTYTRAGLEVRFERVAHATARRVVQQADPSLLQPFIRAAQALERAGVHLITTSCGFLARDQQPLQEAVAVPLISSSLLMCAGLDGPGIVTFDAASLGPEVLAGAGVAPETPIAGLEAGCALQTAIFEDRPSLDLEAARDDVVRAARRLVQLHPQVKNIVLECANMPPYRKAVAQATGRPVHDLETLLLQTLHQADRIGRAGS